MQLPMVNSFSMCRNHCCLYGVLSPRCILASSFLCGSRPTCANSKPIGPPPITAIVSGASSKLKNVALVRNGVCSVSPSILGIAALAPVAITALRKRNTSSSPSELLTERELEERNLAVPKKTSTPSFYNGTEEYFPGRQYTSIRTTEYMKRKH